MDAELMIEASVDNIDEVTEFVNGQLEQMNCDMRVMTKVDIALDELFSNICNYAYDGGVGMAHVGIQRLPEKNAVQIVLRDSGTPFNPLEKEDPDITLGPHEREVGGLGIFIVKKLMNDITYEYIDGMNTITVEKLL